MSQLDLALEANVSARHISFLETGRAKPSREMVLQLAETMRLPLRARNELLEQAGFTRAFAERRLDAAALRPLRHALDHMLRSHLPYPAVIFDRHWNIVDANPAAVALLAPLQGDPPESNMIRLVVSETARAAVVNWPALLVEFYSRLRLELGRSGNDPVLADLLALLHRARDEAAASAGETRPEAETTSDLPAIPVILRLGGRQLSLVSMFAEFGTPRDITLSDLRIELFFPADDEAETWFRGGG